MKYNFIFLFAVFFCTGFGQEIPKTAWEGDSGNLYGLKKETNIKLVVCLDSFVMEGGSKILEKQAGIWYTLLELAFEDHLNKAFHKTKKFSTDLSPGTYSYILKIIPLNFYTLKYRVSSDAPGAFNPITCHVEEMFGDYRFEVWDSTGTNCLNTITVKDLKNATYAVNSCDPAKRNRNVKDQIYDNLESAGSKFGTYFEHLIITSITPKK